MFMKWIWVSFSLIIWSMNAHSRELKYADLPALISSGNGKVLAERDQVRGSKALTGSFARSFIPELKVFAGSEHFDSKGLGTHQTDFYGITTTVNVFNGMRDYWEEKRRQEHVRLSELEAVATEKRMLFETRKAYLNMYMAKKLIHLYEESFSRISEVERKIKGRVKGGVISSSDLVILSMTRIGLKESLRELTRDFELAHARLQNLLGLAEPAQLVVNEDFLKIPEDPEPFLLTERRSLAAQKLKIEADALEKAGHVQGNAILPSLDLYASYQQQPYSQREIQIDENRREFRAGVVASWSFGDALENRSQAKSLDWNARAAKRLSKYYESEYENQVEALKRQATLYRESFQEITDEFKVGKNYYNQISGEYIRGVKSTSDLIAAFNQILEFQQRRIQLGVGYKLTLAEIEALQ